MRQRACAGARGRRAPLRRAWSRSPTSTFRSAPASGGPFSARTAPARRRCSTPSPATFPPTSGRIRFFGEDITELSRPRADPARPAPDLSDQPAVRRPDGDRQHFCRLPRRVARAASRCCGPASDDATMAQARIDRPSRPSRRYPRDAGFGAEPRPAAPARNRAGAYAARRASSCSTSRPPACRRPSGAISSRSSTRCPRISATSSSSTISTSRCASRPM